MLTSLLSRRVSSFARAHAQLRTAVFPLCFADSTHPHRKAFQLPSRHFATRSAADRYLVELLKSDINRALRQEARNRRALKGSAGPFELEDKPGTDEILLNRTVGNERIVVTCWAESDYQDEQEEVQNEDDSSGVSQQGQAVGCLHLNVRITKGPETPVLEMQCLFCRDGEEVIVEGVSYLTDISMHQPDKKFLPYDGPNFEDLDESVQRAFHELLKARGLTPRVATHVLDYWTVKKQREYMGWLQNIQTFFTS